MSGNRKSVFSKMVLYKNQLREARDNTDYVTHIYFEEKAAKEKIEDDLKSSRRQLEETRQRVEFLEKEVQKLRKRQFEKKN